MDFLLLLPLWLIAGMIVFVWRYGALMKQYWREPMLYHPVVVIESDDWGPADDHDAVALERIIALLQGYTDSSGRHPVMTIGVTLAIPDSLHMRNAESLCYRPLLLDAPQFTRIRSALARGSDSGVFSLQLHGMEHYWPAAIIAAAKDNPEIHKWLTQDAFPRSEQLPPELQSRWVDASTLPSAELSRIDINREVTNEVKAFGRIFGFNPLVVVPPTFLWTDKVERAWAEEGVEVIVTPGCRFESRDKDGVLVEGTTRYYNGKATESGLISMVRKDYFEPSYGHGAARGLGLHENNVLTARPTLYETHRFNFLDDQVAGNSLDELDNLLAAVLDRYPDTQFFTTYTLAREMADPASKLVMQECREKIQPWIGRLSQVSGLKKTAILTGVIILAALLYLVGRPARSSVYR